MKNLDEIIKGISGFIKYWEKLLDVDSMGDYRRGYEHLYHYWCAVKDALVLPVQPLSSLQDWLVTWFASVLGDQFIKVKNVCEEYDEDDHFVGQGRDRLAPSFQVLRDLFEGYFVTVWLADGES